LRDNRDFYQFLLGYLGRDNPQIEELDRLCVRSYIAFLHRKGRSSATIHRRMAALNCFFEFLRRHKLITRNPIRGLPRPKLRKGLPPFIGEKELGRILDQLPSETAVEKRDRAMMELFYGGGLRLSELIGLSLKDLEAGNILRVMGKGSKERLVPLGRRALTALQDYLHHRSKIASNDASSALFINSRGHKLERRFVQLKVKILLKSISGNMSPHDLRHAFATHLMRRGADLRAIQELLGHKNLTATQIYTHLCPQDLRNIYIRTHPRAHRNSN
jgi:integrase/recombinase XerC